MQRGHWLFELADVHERLRLGVHELQFRSLPRPGDAVDVRGMPSDLELPDSGDMRRRNEVDLRDLRVRLLSHARWFGMPPMSWRRLLHEQRDVRFGDHSAMHLVRTEPFPRRKPAV